MKEAAMSRKLDRDGMTLIEMIVALAIFAVVTAVVIGFLTGSRRTYESTSDHAHIQQSARAVISMMMRELRSTGCDPTEVGVEGLVGADVMSLRCRMDLDGDGTTLGTGPDEDVLYTYDAGAEELSRRTADGTVVVLRDVESFSLSYFDEAGAPLTATPLIAADRARVRFVRIEIGSRLDSGAVIEHDTRVFIRNG
jgi:prepilin-type N-terminal cleavage/methylation domain-containing protein